MLNIAIEIAPIFLLIVLGYGLRRGGIPRDEFWLINDKLVYWVLMPALIWNRISQADLASQPFGTFGASLLIGLAGAIVISLAVSFVLRFPAPVTTSVMQGAARHNSFVALAVAEALYGEAGLAVGILATAILVPFTNLTIVPLIVVIHKGGKKGNLFLPILRDLSRNPLILAVLFGLVSNVTGLGQFEVFTATTGLLGAAALPVMLLTVGATLMLSGLQAQLLPLLVSVISKLLLFPIIVLIVGMALGLSGTVLTIAILYAAVPTAVSSYTLARQMGGDAPLMGAIVTIQTLISFVSLPLILSLLG